MARQYRAMSPDDRRSRAQRRREREADADPETAALRKAKRSATLKRYFASRRDDAEFMARRVEYLRRWRQERRLDEEFDAFVARLEAE